MILGKWIDPNIDFYPASRTVAAQHDGKGGVKGVCEQKTCRQVGDYLEARDRRELVIGPGEEILDR